MKYVCVSVIERQIRGETVFEAEDDTWVYNDPRGDYGAENAAQKFAERIGADGNTAYDRLVWARQMDHKGDPIDPGVLIDIEARREVTYYTTTRPDDTFTVREE